MPHYLPTSMLKAPVQITLIGCGGNGSQMLTGLARLNHALRALEHPGLDVTVYDPDIVSEANMGRQLFSPADVGQSKAVVLTHRLNAFFGTRWSAIPEHFGNPVRGIHIAIACVDSARARANISDHLDNCAPLYLMDLGNREADGQVVLGEWDDMEELKLRHADHVALTNPYKLLPELVDANSPADDAPSCGLAEALERQELFVNQAIVTPALHLLWEFFRRGKLTWHGAFVNLRTGSMRPLRVATPSQPAAPTRKEKP